MAKSKMRRLKLQQLSNSVKNKSLVSIDRIGQRIKDIREALGMTQKQLAKRLKVKQPVVSRIEEKIESSSLKTVSKLLKALECEFMGGIVANLSLEGLVRKQAEKKAQKILSRTFSNMALERQALNDKAYKYQYEKLVAELVANPGPELWED